MIDPRPWKVLDDCGNILSAHSAEVDAVRSAGHRMATGRYVYISRPCNTDCWEDCGSFALPEASAAVRETVSEISSSEDAYLQKIVGNIWRYNPEV